MIIPARLQEIMSDFEISEGREKLELLLEYSEQLPPLPEWLQADQASMDSVPECMTPVAVYAEQQDGGMRFYFDVPPESPTVRGYAAILAQGLEGATPEQILTVPNDFYQQMGLHTVLSHQRLRGMGSILAHIKQQAVKVMGEEA